MNRENCILIVAGPSGAGKTVIAEAIREKDPRFDFIRSATTRAKRGDAHDDEYLYYTAEEFDRAIANDDILEYMEYAGSKYGTPRKEIENAIAAGKIPLLVLDLVGVESMASKKGFSPCSVYVFSHIDELRRRLHNRYLGQGETEEGKRNFNTRYDRNLVDFSTLDKYAEHFFAFVKNDSTIESCRDEIMRIFFEFIGGADKDTELLSGRLAEIKEYK